MKRYPSIEFRDTIDHPVYAFDKIDGSNVRAEWNRKRGFYKFGTRNRLVDPKTEQGYFKEVPDLILQQYGEDLNRIFWDKRYESAIAFFEFWGDRSRFGQHKDEEHRVTLIDVNPYKKGILDPEEFIRQYGHLQIPNIVHYGKVDQEFCNRVRNSEVSGLTFEGVVYKAAKGEMYKQKTVAWFKALEEFCKGNSALYRELM